MGKETEIITIPKGIHHTEHESGGTDEISVAALSGLLADDQHVLDAEVLAAAIAGGLIQGTSGSYTGNSTVNRAIPHGLGRTPKMVFLVFNAGLKQFIIQLAFITKIEHNVATLCYVITTPDATNFYVGNATDYEASANAVHLYDWVAIG